MNGLQRMTMKTLLCCVIVALPIGAFGQAPDAVEKKIDALHETEKAILKELQEIKGLLQQQPGRPPAEVLPAAPVDISKAPFEGASNASVVLIAFSDYQCPFCASFGKDTYPRLIKEYVDTGKVKYVWRDLPLEMHPYAFKAAEAAHCAGDQGHFWQMHDRLFANRESLAPSDLAKHAAALELNSVLFQQCLDNGRHANGIRQDIADAGKLGVTGSPSFLIGVVQPNGLVKVERKLVGAKSFEEFKSAIDASLGSAR